MLATFLFIQIYTLNLIPRAKMTLGLLRDGEKREHAKITQVLMVGKGRVSNEDCDFADSKATSHQCVQGPLIFIQMSYPTTFQ